MRSLCNDLCESIFTDGSDLLAGVEDTAVVIASALSAFGRYTIGECVALDVGHRDRALES